MAFFPIGIELEGRACLVVGGGPVALRKTAALLDFGGMVTVIAPKLEGGFKSLKKRFPKELTIYRKEFRETDLGDWNLVVAATNQREINHKIAVICKEEGRLVNVVDNPGECSFFFPAIVKRGDVVISVSTSGKSPVLSRYLREQMQNDLPDHIDEVAQVMEEYRDYVIERVPEQSQRREIFRQMLKWSLENQDRISREDIQEMIEDLLTR